MGSRHQVRLHAAFTTLGVNALAWYLNEVERMAVSKVSP
jgi:hypothetical protein